MDKEDGPGALESPDTGGAERSMPRKLGGPKGGRSGSRQEMDPIEALDLSRSLRKRMQDILKKDNANNLEGRPATGKIGNVEEISSLLMNKALQETLLDEGVLEDVRRWLEPLPDKSMPNIKVKKTLLDALKTMKIHKEHLATSGVGKIVYFYSINPKEVREIRALAKALVQKWTNEIFKPENGD